MSVLDSLSTASYSPGATSALSKGRDEQAARRAEAMRQGRAAGSQEEIEKKVRGVAEEFVSVFMNQVMKSMRATVNENPAMHGDNGEKFFQELLDTEQSKTLAMGSGYGLTDLIYESMMTSYRVTQPQADGQAGDSMDQSRMDSFVESVDDVAVEGIE